MPRESISTKHGRGDQSSQSPRAGLHGAAPRHASTGRGAYAQPAQSKKARRKRRQAVSAGTPSPAAYSPAQSEPLPQPVSHGEEAHPTSRDTPSPLAQGGSLEWQAAAARKSLEVQSVSNPRPRAHDATHPPMRATSPRRQVLSHGRELFAACDGEWRQRQGGVSKHTSTASCRMRTRRTCSLAAASPS